VEKENGMSGKAKDDGRQATEGDGALGNAAVLANALSFEQAKNKVLLDEVLSLEDALVNRQMVEFDAVISDDTRDFWREQLLANREKAEVALRELAQVKPEAGGRDADGGGRRPLHNRAAAHPAARGADGAPTGGKAEGQAVKIRNRAHELRKSEGIPFSTAFRRAEQEIVGA
jgi:hypothetical protein